MAMRRVEVEIARADSKVLRIRCLDDGNSAGPQHAHRFVQQMNHVCERQVLDDMEAGNCSDGRILERFEIFK